MPRPDLVELAATARRLRSAIPEPDRCAISDEAIQNLFERLKALQGSACREHGVAEDFPPPAGQRISGTYLDHPMTGVVISLVKLADTDVYRVAIKFDEAIDAATFPGQSVHRDRISCLIDGAGVSMARTSKDQPYLVLDRCPPPGKKKRAMKLTIQRM
ncbi:glyoxalase superfamily protein [Roseibium sediminis]|uniref:glyoxalase superfamily protein n=1 Tax=Roseibium sediminis TaxID=1775174 RepID=UPI00123D6588|nr:glyoxalase superfamily protein [Roseibium sediminis]